MPIDNRSIPVEQYLATYTQGKGFDIVYDTVGGATLDASFQAVKRYTGHALSCLGWDSHSLAPLSFRGATYSGVFTLLPLITGEGRAHHGQILAQAAARAEAGKLRPLLNERRFSTADIDAAHALVESGAWEKWSLPASLLQPTCRGWVSSHLVGRRLEVGQALGRRRPPRPPYSLSGESPKANPIAGTTVHRAGLLDCGFAAETAFRETRPESAQQSRTRRALDARSRVSERAPLH